MAKLPLINARLHRLRRNHQQLKVQVAQKGIFIADWEVARAIAKKEAAMAHLHSWKTVLKVLQHNVNKAREDYGAARAFEMADEESDIWTEDMAASSEADAF